MANTYTDEQRTEALRIFEEDGALAAAETIGCSRRQIYRWYKAFVTSHIKKSEEDLQAEEVYQSAMRLRARRRMLERIENLFDRMDQPHIDFRGKDVIEVTFPTASSGDIKNYTTSIAILLDKYRLERGESTDRVEGKMAFTINGVDVSTVK